MLNGCAEEETRLINHQVLPIDADSAPYDFNLADNPVLRSAARALNLPARSSQSYLSLFPNASSSKGCPTGSIVSEMERKYFGHFVVSGYNVCFVLPTEFPPLFSRQSSSTDSDGGQLSSRNAHSSFKSRRSSALMRPSLQFVAALELRVPFLSKVSGAVLVSSFIF